MRRAALFFTLLLLILEASEARARLARAAGDVAENSAAIKAVASTDRAISNDSAHAEINWLLQQGERLRQEHNAVSIDSAVRLFNSVLTLAESHFGPADSSIGGAFYGLAICANWQGQTGRADSLLNRATAIWSALHGEDHPDIAAVLSYRAFMLPPLGRYAQAEELFRRAILIFERSPEENYKQLATAQHGLGWLYLNLERYPEADSLFRLSLGTWDRAGCDRCYGAGLEYLELGICARESGRLAESEQHLRIALEIFVDSLGADHHITGIAHSEAALLLVAQRRYDEARPHLERAVAITEDAFSRENSQLVQPLARLADLECRAGDLAAARDHYERALRISRNMGRTPDQPSQMSLIAGLATVEYLLGNEQKSIAYFQSASMSVQESLRDIFSYASEDLKLWFSEQDSPISDELLTLALREGVDSAVDPAFDMLLKGKALVIDVLASERATIYCSEDSMLVRMEGQRADVCGRIASLTRACEQSSIPGQRIDSLEHLYWLKDSLETQLAEQCGSFRDAAASAQFTIADVARTLDPGTVLWEFVTYRPRVFAAHLEDGPRARPRYAGFALTAAGDLTAADLGPTAEIDSLIHLCRDQIQSFADGSVKQSESDAETDLALNSLALCRRLFDPFAKLLAHNERIIISPDGELNLLPFEILQPSNGTYAIEQHQISYISTGRDLLRTPLPAESAGDYAVVVADPDFDATAPVTYAAVAPSELSAAPDASRGRELRGQCVDRRFWRLAASADEGRAVASFLSQSMRFNVDLFVGAAASAWQLRTLRAAPRVLHVATHGYYCTNSDVVPVGSVPSNPLLNSGLVLAGANARLMAHSADTDSALTTFGDGLLSALELSGLNLVGNELTVLSACQTGVGSVVSGEGVFGLRRALQHAGTRSLIVSEFPVSDETVEPLMTSFYENWSAGLTKSAALHRAALNQLNERRRTHGASHPLHWGGFVLIGDPD